MYVSVQPSGRPHVDCGYVEPTLAGYAHEIIIPEAPSSSLDTPINNNNNNTTTDAPTTRGRIYLGPQQAARKDALLELQTTTPPVTGIVNCTISYPNHHDDMIEYCNVPVHDETGSDLMLYMKGTSHFIERHVSQGGSVLVHCSFGMSRSVTMVIAYLIQYHGMSREEAYIVVKTCRPLAAPNRGFWKQLKVYEDTFRDKETNDPQEEIVKPDCLFTEYFWEQLAHFDHQYSTQKEDAETLQLVKNGIPPNFTSEYGIRQSLATFQTIGHLLDDVREGFPELTSSLSVHVSRRILFISLHFILSRGILNADLPWFGALCRVMTMRNDVDCSKVVASILDKGSEFEEMWTGEIYEKDVTRIQQMIKDDH